MHHNWVRITVFAIFAAFLAIALIALQSAQTTSATEFAPASPTVLYVESDSECTNASDDNGNAQTGHDGVNEGCPRVGTESETGSQCFNSTNDADGGTTDSVVNDGCPGLPNGGDASETPDTTALFDIPAPSAQFCCSVAFTDPAATVSVGGSGGAMDLGAIVGLVDSKATLGLINDPCSAVLLVPLTMMNASTDTGDTIDADGPPDNLLLPLAQDDPQETQLNGAITDANSTADIVVDDTTGFKGAGQIEIDLEKIDYTGTTGTSFTGITRGVDSTTKATHLDNSLVFQQAGAAADDLADIVTRYPSYLNVLFDRGDGTPLTPRFRYVGIQDVAGLIVILNLVGFDAGELRKLPGGGGAVASLGTGVVTVLQDPTQAASNSAITDFCAPLITDVELLGVSNDNECTITTVTGCVKSVSTDLGARDIFKGVDGGDTGGESGATRLTTPAAAGTITNTQMFASTRDFDNDGIESFLEACHSTDSGTFDPRSSLNFTTDFDGDGLDVSCEETGQDTVANSDEDGDKYLNRLDNCALIPNGDSEVQTAASSGTFIIVDSTAGFTAGNDILISIGSVAERRTIDSIDAGMDKLLFTTALTKSHLVNDPVSQIFVPNTNDGQNDTDILFPIPVPDGGPRSDSIGPACDSGVTINGEPLADDVPNGHFHRTATVSYSCVLGGTVVDTDQDGACGGSGFVQIPIAAGFAEDDASNPCPGAVGDCGTAAACTNGIDDDVDGVAGDGCEENDSTNDTDGDGVLDGVDNCLNTDNAPSAGFTQDDVDADGIGDLCETVNSTTNTNDNDGDGFSNTLEGVVTTASEAGLSGLNECGNALDDDDDGFFNDGCPAWGDPETACSDAVDSDRDLYVNDGCPPNGDPEDASAISTGPELHCATNSLDPVGSYPPDVDGNGAIGVADLSLIAGPIGTSTVSGGGSTPDRRDIGPEPVGDNSITSVDLGAVAAHIAETC